MNDTNNAGAAVLWKSHTQGSICTPCTFICFRFAQGGKRPKSYHAVSRGFCCVHNRSNAFNVFASCSFWTGPNIWLGEYTSADEVSIVVALSYIIILLYKRRWVKLMWRAAMKVLQMDSEVYCCRPRHSCHQVKHSPRQEAGAVYECFPLSMK